MLPTIIVAVMLFALLAEVARGFLTRRSDGKKDAFIALAGAVACVAYLIGDRVPDYLLLTFLVVGVIVAGGGYLVVTRRGSSAASRSHRLPNGNNGASKKRFWMLLLAVDAVGVALGIAAVGRPALVIGTFLVVNLIALAVSGVSYRRASTF